MQAELRNGFITGYIITYQSETENNNGHVEAGLNVRQVNLTGLKEFVKYTISVFASLAEFLKTYLKMHQNIRTESWP